MLPLLLSQQQFTFSALLLLLIRMSQHSVVAFSTTCAPLTKVGMHRCSTTISLDAERRSSRRRRKCLDHFPHYASAIGSSSSAAWDESDDENNNNNNNNKSKTNKLDLLDNNGVDQIFNQVDIDGSGSIDIDEFHQHLQPIGYSADVITKSFQEMDLNHNGQISRQEFRSVMAMATKKAQTQAQSQTRTQSATIADDECPKGYFLNSVQKACQPLGPIGRISQSLETMGPFRRIYQRISNLFGIETKRISKLGVSFALSYSIISNLNGAISFTVSWYISCRRTGLSPLVPGQWKNLLSSYGMIYGIIQLLRPFRVAAAIAMSKLSAEYLEMIQNRLHCSRRAAIAFQYVLGQLMMGVCSILGVILVRMITGVPIFGPS